LLTDWFMLVVQDTKLMCDYKGEFFPLAKWCAKL